MIVTILCFLGFHQWHYQYDNQRKCWNCQKVQVVYLEEGISSVEEK